MTTLFRGRRCTFALTSPEVPRCRYLRPQSPPTPTGLLTGVLVKVGYAKDVRPRSGENFGVVAALVKPPAAVAASTGREREGKRAPRSGIFFRSGCIFESEKHQNPSYFKRNGNGDAATTRGPYGCALGFVFVSCVLLFFQLSSFWKKVGKSSNHAKHKKLPNAARGINTVARLFFAPRIEQGVNINPPPPVRFRSRAPPSGAQ